MGVASAPEGIDVKGCISPAKPHSAGTKSSEFSSTIVSRPALCAVEDLYHAFYKAKGLFEFLKSKSHDLWLVTDNSRKQRKYAFCRVEQSSIRMMRHLQVGIIDDALVAPSFQLRHRH